MNSQRQVQDMPVQAPAPGAPRIEAPLGGQVGLWHERIDQAFAVELTPDPLERVVSTLSRWAGPATFVATLAIFVYYI